MARAANEPSRNYNQAHTLLNKQQTRDFDDLQTCNVEAPERLNAPEYCDIYSTLLR